MVGRNKNSTAGAAPNLLVCVRWGVSWGGHFYVKPVPGLSFEGLFNLYDHRNRQRQGGVLVGASVLATIDDVNNLALDHQGRPLGQFLRARRGLKVGGISSKHPRKSLSITRWIAR